MSNDSFPVSSVREVIYNLHFPAETRVLSLKDAMVKGSSKVLNKEFLRKYEDFLSALELNQDPWFRITSLKIVPGTCITVNIQLLVLVDRYNYDETLIRFLLAAKKEGILYQFDKREHVEIILSTRNYTFYLDRDCSGKMGTFSIELINIFTDTIKSNYVEDVLKRLILHTHLSDSKFFQSLFPRSYRWRDRVNYLHQVKEGHLYKTKKGQTVFCLKNDLRFIDGVSVLTLDGEKIALDLMDFKSRNKKLVEVFDFTELHYTLSLLATSSEKEKRELVKQIIELLKQTAKNSQKELKALNEAQKQLKQVIETVID